MSRERLLCQITFRLVDSLEEFKVPSSLLYSMLAIQYIPGMQRKISKGKKHMVKFWRILRIDSKGLPSVKLPRTGLIPPAVMCGNTSRVLPTKVAHQRLSGQGQRLVTQVPSAYHVPKFQIPRRKSGVEHKPRC